MKEKHWSKIQFLHEAVTNPNIVIKGTHSYYSDCWSCGFEESVVRYLYGDKISLQWESKWPIDKLYIGDYVCIGAETIILMGGNNTHRADWFCLYPFMEYIEDAYVGKGDTHIHDGVWLGMRSMIMPGVTIGEGAIVAANSVVTKDVEPYSIVVGTPARLVKYRFEPHIINELLALKIYDWSEEKFNALKPYLCASDIKALKSAVRSY
ncbi:antibiotic acetyltransferase [Photorhabdus luminescens subsp. luminescens]|uniref:Chloramphenicol acetyltransferase n=1 Tax=Photorhabdus luminescens TaxID=29488 RepID=A0A1G5Q0E8_PHOLU|nr:CatB-related O-acetyltransferase [Photorhabdus luminescens]KMW73722.1 antibiotic acetyltransferase [Photorhabdus luminescens subsp. luminescens]SCZ55345.1 chloramphenicol O-acetyltransferase type B [Photorhabdus luminescens]